MATVVVVVLYVAVVAVVDFLVTQRMVSQIDASLSRHVAAVDRSTLTVPGAPLTDRDTDHDVPTFVWRVAPGGRAVPVTVGAPSLPRRAWPEGSVTTLSITGVPFRFYSVAAGHGWLVAGQSVAQVNRVRSDLFLSEALVGMFLAVVAYLGALVVGLRASAPVEEVRRQQAEFTADASHELRTPLSVIEAEVDLALARPRDGGYYAAAMGRIRGESQRLRGIVDDLLWLARADAGIPGATSDATDLVPMVRAAVDRFGAVAAARQVTLSHRSDAATGAFVAAPPEWLDRLLGVLLDNACRYAGEGGCVEVSVVRSGNRVVLAVDDSGPGIPEEERRRVFDRFHRAVEDPSGTGLGLPIADAVVRRTGGHWDISDSGLGGARMQVTWRRTLGAPTRQAAAHPHRRGRDPAAPGGPEAGADGAGTAGEGASAGSHR